MNLSLGFTVDNSSGDNPQVQLVCTPGGIDPGTGDTAVGCGPGGSWPSGLQPQLINPVLGVAVDPTTGRPIPLTDAQTAALQAQVAASNAATANTILGLPATTFYIAAGGALLFLVLAMKK